MLSVKIDHVDFLVSVALTNMPVHVTPLFHPDSAVGTLDLRFLAALEFYVSLQVPCVHVTLGTLRTRVSAVLELFSISADGQQLPCLVVGYFRFRHHY